MQWLKAILFNFIQLTIDKNNNICWYVICDALPTYVWLQFLYYYTISWWIIIISNRQNNKKQVFIWIFSVLETQKRTKEKTSQTHFFQCFFRLVLYSISFYLISPRVFEHFMVLSYTLLNVTHVIFFPFCLSWFWLGNKMKKNCNVYDRLDRFEALTI